MQGKAQFEKVDNGQKADRRHATDRRQAKGATKRSLIDGREKQQAGHSQQLKKGHRQLMKAAGT